MSSQTKAMEALTQSIQELTNRVVFKEDLKTELAKYATKEDLRSEIKKIEAELFEMRWDMKKFATHEDLVQFKDEILSAIDAIGVQHRTFDQELLMLRSQYMRHENRLEVIEDKLDIKSL